MTSVSFVASPTEARSAPTGRPSMHSRKRAPLASFDGRLDPQRFVRVHRAAIVNVAEVREVHEAGCLLLVLSDGSHVPVSRSRRRQVEPLMLRRTPN